jgi:hypothetical protein
MLGNRIEHVGAFAAHDALGDWYTIHVFQEFQDCGNPKGTQRGATLLETDDGRPVARLETGRYRIADRLAIEVVSEDPAAP